MAPHPDNFRPLLKAFLDRGYRFSGFAGTSEGRTVMLRHDIDFSLESALEAAVIEQELGIAATYFFMLSSNFYNLWSPHARGLVERIAALGMRSASTTTRPRTRASRQGSSWSAMRSSGSSRRGSQR